jgi:hypothetical protein
LRAANRYSLGLVVGGYLAASHSFNSRASPATLLWSFSSAISLHKSFIVTDTETQFALSELLSCDYFKKYRDGYYKAKDAGCLNTRLQAIS